MVTNLKKHLALIAFNFVFITMPFAQNTITYYVGYFGNDANAGTKKAPFKTIQKCIDQWDGVNQFICACTGTFHEKLIIDQSGPSPKLKNKIIPWDQSANGNLAEARFTLDGENLLDIAVANKTVSPYSKPDNIEIAGADFRNYFPVGGCITGGNNLASFIDLSCSGGGIEGGCTDWYIHDCTFVNIGYKSDSVRCNAESHYIAIKPTNASRMIIERNTFKNIYAFLMRYIDGADIQFINNDVEIATTGIKGWGDNLDRMYIYGNTFRCDGNGNPYNTTCKGQSAVNLSNNARNAIIANNTFYDCVQCIHLGTDPNFATRDNTGHLIMNNIIHHTEKVCNKFNAPIAIDDCSPVSNVNGLPTIVSNITFINNIINYRGTHTTSSQWNQGAAIELESGHPFDFQNNIKIYNNTIKGYYWALRFTQCKIGTSYTPYQINGIGLINNIYTSIRDAQYTLSTNGLWENNSPRNLVSQSNRFFGKDRFKWETNKTLSQWQSEYNQDLNSVFCQPAFLDTVHLHLHSTDQCAQDVGLSLIEVPYDFDKESRPFRKQADIGADENYEMDDDGEIIEISSLQTKTPSNGLIFNKSNESILIYPNPSQHHLNISFPFEIAGTLTLVNALGKIIFSEALTSIPVYQKSIYNLTPGVYFIKIEDVQNKRIYTNKFIKK